MSSLKRHFSSFLFETIFYLKEFPQNYNQIKNIENDKLLKPVIKKAYFAVQVHLLITAGIYGACLIFSSKSFFSIIELLHLFLLLALCGGVFFFANKWIGHSLNNNKIKLATNIYFTSNIYSGFIPVIGFSYLEGYTDYDRAILLPIVLYCYIYFLNMIPGNILSKILQYIFAMIFILIIIKPRFSYGTFILIAHFIGGIVQLYINWERYHEECQLLNQIEYERNVSNFLQNKSPEPIFTLTKNLEIYKCNEKASLLLKEIGVSTFKYFSLLLQSSHHLNLYKTLMEDPQIDNIEFTLEKVGSPKRIILVSSSSFQVESKIVIILIIKDLTIMFNKQEKLMNEKYQSILLFSAPHEIRSQLNLITGNLEQIEKTFDLKCLKIAKYASKVMEYKLNLIFDFVHFTTNKFSEHLKKIKFKRFMEEIADIISLFSKEKKIEFKFSYKTKNNILLCDEDRLFSILIHIALNGIKHTVKGQIRLSVQYKKGFIFAIINDTGIGMPPSIVNHINRISQINDLDNHEVINCALQSMEDSKFLTGIGTITSALVCKKLGGNLFIKSIKNLGTEVSLKIKCQSITESLENIDDETCNIDSESDQYERCYTVPNSFRKEMNGEILNENNDARQNLKKSLKILIVDDIPFNRVTLKDMLNSLNIIDISEAENGHVATLLVNDFLKSYQQISIFMDIEMPIMNGIEATKIIKSIDKANQVKIVMLSAFSGEEIIRESFKAGAIEFYLKPISFKKLKEMKESKFIIF